MSGKMSRIKLGLLCAAELRVVNATRRTFYEIVKTTNNYIVSSYHQHFIKKSLKISPFWKQISSHWDVWKLEGQSC